MESALIWHMEEMEEQTQRKKRGLIRWLYDWVISFSGGRAAQPALFGLALAESVFFPVPPDVLLVSMGIAKPRRSFWYAVLSSLGSLLGAAVGFAIGYFLRDTVALPLLRFFGLEERFAEVAGLYRKWAALAVAAAAFTPIPYKVFTIGAGLCHVNFVLFILVSAVFRTARFMLLAALLFFFGERVRPFIEKHLGWVTLGVFVLVVVVVLIVAL